MLMFRSIEKSSTKMRACHTSGSIQSGEQRCDFARKDGSWAESHRWKVKKRRDSQVRRRDVSY